ncbi:flagellar export chaperone FliS [Aquabacterium sp.]|uniref:flagellar export chaperone FliS n=1 Tax=Aquabacterium sp. TaxID=1872578 RepID=UPI003BF61A05
MYATATGSSVSMFSSRNVSNAYRQIDVQTGVNGASDHQLISMLFNGFFQSIGQARVAMQKGEIPEKCAAITKCVRIVDEGLKASLNLQQGGELAQQLNDLYEYVTRRLTQANLRNDVDALDECVRLLSPIREAWDAVAPGHNDAPRAAMEIRA